MARVDGLDRDDLRDLAVAVRDQPRRPGRRARRRARGRRRRPSSPPSRPTAGCNAAELIADAAKAVKGGGGKSADLAVAGGKDPSALDDALDLARAAAGIA